MFKNEEMTMEQEKRMLKLTKGDLNEVARFVDICKAVRENLADGDYSYLNWMNEKDVDIVDRAADIAERKLGNIYDAVLWMYEVDHLESV